MKVLEEMKALHKALTLYFAIERLDKTFTERLFYKNKKIEGLSERQKRLWHDTHMSFEGAKVNLERKLEHFIKKYGELPIINEENKIIVRFNGKHVKGYKTYFPLNKNLLNEINIPNVPPKPKKLSEVF